MLSAIRRFCALPLPDQAATLEALMTLATVRARLIVLSDAEVGQWLRARLRGPSVETQWLARGGTVERVRIAVQRASPRIPGASCLVQAVAGSYMLESRGIASQIRIGVNKNVDNLLAAHAWLTVGDVVVLGGSKAPRDFEELT